MCYSSTVHNSHSHTHRALAVRWQCTGLVLWCSANRVECCLISIGYWRSDKQTLCMSHIYKNGRKRGWTSLHWSFPELFQQDRPKTNGYVIDVDDRCLISRSPYLDPWPASVTNTGTRDAQTVCLSHLITTFTIVLLFITNKVFAVKTNQSFDPKHFQTIMNFKINLRSVCPLCGLTTGPGAVTEPPRALFYSYVVLTYPKSLALMCSNHIKAFLNCI